MLKCVVCLVQKSTPHPSGGADHHRHRSERHSPERRSRDPELPRPSSKKKTDYEDLHRHKDHRSNMDYEDHLPRHKDHRGSHKRRSESPSEPTTAASAAAEKNRKASVFSRISFPDHDPTATKKRKTSSSSSEPPATGGTSTHRVVVNGHREEHKGTSGSRKSAAAASVDERHDSSDDERHFKRRPSRYTSSPPPPPSASEEEHRHSRGSRDRERERASHGKHR